MMAYRTYDHRIKQLIAASGNPDLFWELKIPRTTALTWIRNGVRDIVTTKDLNQNFEDLVVEKRELERELDSLKAIQSLTIATFRIFGLQIQFKRLPTTEAKADLIERIKSTAKVCGLKAALEAIGLSVQRYNAWLRRQKQCRLQDQSTCAKLKPTKLPTAEMDKIKEYVTSKDYEHFSIPSLVWYARRAGEVFASATTWYRVIRKFELKRMPVRVYPPRPKEGIRASAPNQIWHIDQTMIRLQDRTRVFIQSIIDNFSRMILATNVSLSYGGSHTVSLLSKALTKAKELGNNTNPMILADDGSENSNDAVSSFLSPIGLALKIAQIDIEFSNSMIEAFFKSLKHRYLFNQPFATIESLQEHVEFYVNQHNQVIPQDVLGGATPVEIFTGKWSEDVVDALKLRYLIAREARRATNLSLLCQPCQ
jgi:transposase InsO family protein